ncbi:unnamed protein product [Bathycoccus prasinos]
MVTARPTTLMLFALSFNRDIGELGHFSSMATPMGLLRDGNLMVMFTDTEFNNPLSQGHHAMNGMLETTASHWKLNQA